MGQVFKENIPALVKSSSTVITLAATNLGQPTHIQIGGQSYSLTAGLSMSTATVGFNGLDTGTMAINTLYHVYAILQSGVVGLIISVTGPTTGPTGFTSAYKFLGKFRTDVAATTIAFVATDSTVQPQGAVVGEWTSFTPSFANITLGNGTPTGFYRRVGSTMEINTHLLWGSTTSCSGGVSFTVPSSLTIDTARTAYGTTSSGSMTIGIVSTYDNSTGEEYSGNAFVVSTTTIGAAVSYAITVNFLYAGNLVNANNPTTWATNDRLDIKVSIPISEWAGLYT